VCEIGNDNAQKEYYFTDIFAIARRKGVVQQELTFAMLVENQAYDKQVEVHWAGEDGRWQTLPAEHRYTTGQNQECWQAQATVQLAEVLLSNK
jgi:maltose 6'-phosphate phosphatase